MPTSSSLTPVFTGANQLSGVKSGCLDAHTHVFNRDLPMVADRRYTPGADALLPDLITRLTRHKLVGALLVQPSFLGTDNGFLTQSLAQAANIAPAMQFYGVAVVSPQTTLAELNDLGSAGIIGCRLNLLGREDQFSMSEWQSVLSRVDALGWHIEVHAAMNALPQIVSQLAPVVRTIVIDHFGLPAETEHGLPLPTGITKLGVEQLMVKLSAPYRFLSTSNNTAMAEQCHHLVDYLVSELSENNLMWGSDWPWTQFEDQINYDDAISWRNAWAARLSS